MKYQLLNQLLLNAKPRNSHGCEPKRRKKLKRSRYSHAGKRPRNNYRPRR